MVGRLIGHAVQFFSRPVDKSVWFVVAGMVRPVAESRQETIDDLWTCTRQEVWQQGKGVESMCKSNFAIRDM